MTMKRIWALIQYWPLELIIRILERPSRRQWL